MSKVRDRVAIVTGAGQGLGRSYALALASAGARVLVNDVGLSDGTPTAELVAAEIIASGGRAVANTDSVAAPDGGRNMVEMATAEFGRVDILVSNAGIERNKSYAKSDDAHWHDVIDVHLNGSHNLCRAAWPHLLAQEHGRVILITSPSGLWGNFAQASYAAAKMGLIGLANVLAIEGKRSNVLVNCLAPIAATPMSQHLLAPELAHRLRPELVAPAILQLASDDLTTSGSILVAGGGWFSSAHVVLSPGVHLADGASIEERWNAITAADGASPTGPLDPETLEKMFVRP